MIKPDGRLTDALDPDDQPPRDHCGVFGAWSPDEDVAKLAYFGLYALQHRGQESAGIAVSDGKRIVVYKDMGLVPQVFDESVLTTLRGYITVGHCRYSTSGVVGLGERPADVPGHAHGQPGPGPQRQPDQHAGAGRPGRGAGPAEPGRGGRRMRPPPTPTC